MPDWNRRRFLLTSGVGTLTALTGCFGDTNDDGSPATSTDPATPTRGDDGTATGTETQTANESRDTPGYKQYHWHGKLFVDIDGDLVDFTQSKYYLDNLQDENPETVYFHFHKSAHGPNEWSNEKKVVTFARGLNLLPGIAYEKRGETHAVTYEGTTYDGQKQGTSVKVHEGTEAIDPTSHQVRHDDNYWVQIDTQEGSNDESGGARTGKLLFDVNNRRLNFDRDTYRSASTEQFGFRDDDEPYRWYNEGEPVTLETALNTLPNVEYSQENGEHAIRYKSGEKFDGTYRHADDATEIIVRQRADAVDPTSYELQNGDIIWVYVHTSDAPDNEH